MAPQTAHLLRLAELATADTAGLPASDRGALGAVSEWITDFVARPHADLGREGPVCPFIPGSLERGTIFLAAEQIAGAGALDVAAVMDGYRRVFLATPPLDGDDARYKTIIVVFPDLEAEHAGALFDDVLTRIGIRAYEDDGVIFGPFYRGNAGTALYNPDFRPFQSPVPFLFVRHTVLDDWRFFLDDPTALDRWARHFGAAATGALAQELRRMPWRERTVSSRSRAR